MTEISVQPGTQPLEVSQRLANAPLDEIAALIDGLDSMLSGAWSVLGARLRFAVESALAAADGFEPTLRDQLRRLDTRRAQARVAEVFGTGQHPFSALAEVIDEVAYAIRLAVEVSETGMSDGSEIGEGDSAKERRTLAWALLAGDAADAALENFGIATSEGLRWIVQQEPTVNSFIREIAPAPWAAEAFQLRFMNGDDPDDVAAILDDPAVDSTLVASATDEMFRAFAEEVSRDGEVRLAAPIPQGQNAAAWCRSLLAEYQAFQAWRSQQTIERIRPAVERAITYDADELATVARSQDGPRAVGTQPPDQLEGLRARAQRHLSEILGRLPNLVWGGAVVPVGVRGRDTPDAQRWRASPESAITTPDLAVHFILSGGSLIVDVTGAPHVDAEFAVAVSDRDARVHVAVGELNAGFGSASIDWPGGAPSNVAIATA